MKPLVYQTDFGLVDGAVSAMYGVAYCVEPTLKIHDLTHDITPFDIWEASYRLIQTGRHGVCFRGGPRCGIGPQECCG